MASELIGYSVRFPQVTSQHSCERCAQPIRRRDDYLRVAASGSRALLHWRCFLALMGDSRNTGVEVTR
jgi:hypothetical protein